MVFMTCAVLLALASIVGAVGLLGWRSRGDREDGFEDLLGDGKVEGNEIAPMDTESKDPEARGP
jgi:hypothetical protein